MAPPSAQVHRILTMNRIEGLGLLKMWNDSILYGPSTIEVW